MRITTLLCIFLYVRGCALAFSNFSSTFSRPSSSRLNAAAPPQNEFSRTVDPARVLRKRDYVCRIEATAQECKALAARFDLPDLAALSASLALHGSRRTGDDISVRGTLTATVTRTCVRTNQEFSRELMEQPLEAIVRPVTPLSALLALEETSLPDGKKKKRRANAVDPESMGLMQLQRMLQQDIRSEADDVLMEDEAIYATGGMLDVGELVAQLFWLSLDPYPKKPGTDPVQASISSS